MTDSKSGIRTFPLPFHSGLGPVIGQRAVIRWGLSPRNPVETYYWTLLVELKGAKGLGEALRKMRAQWVAAGCPPEYENTYGGFTEEQGVFARAVLRLQCGVNPQYARARLKELAERGVPEARLFLGQ